MKKRARISGPAVSSAVKSRSVAPPSTATITVDAANVIKKIDNRIYGVNAAAFDELIFQKGVIDENYLQTVKDSRVTVMNYPGGGWSNDFVWNDPAIPTLQTFDQFIEFCRKVGAEPRVSVNLNKPVELATSWVQYSKDRDSKCTTSAERHRRHFLLPYKQPPRKVWTGNLEPVKSVFENDVILDSFIVSKVEKIKKVVLWRR